MAVTETQICNRALQRIGAERIVDMDSDTSKRATACKDAYDFIRDEVLQAFPWKNTTSRAQLVRATVTAATKADPIEITTFKDHQFRNGEQVTFVDVEGMVELNGNKYLVSNVATKTFDLQDLDGNDIDGTTASYTAYSGAGDGTDAGRTYLKPDFEYDQAMPTPADCLRVLGIYDSLDPWIQEDGRLFSDEGTTLRIRYTRQEIDPDRYSPLHISAFAARLATELCETLTQSNTKRQLQWQEYQGILAIARKAEGQEQSPQNLEEDDWVRSRFTGAQSGWRSGTSRF